MIITDYKICGGEVSLSLDGDFWMEIPYEVSFDHKLDKGMQISDSDMEKIEYDTSVLKGMKYAINYLVKYSATENKLYKKLIEKEFPSDVCKHIVARMVEYGYLNDHDYAERLVECKIKKLGKARLRAELYAKGINSDIISEVLDNTLDEDIQENALNVAGKWYNSHELETREDEAKFYRFMQYRGYDYSTINAVKRAIKENLNDD